MALTVLAPDNAISLFTFLFWRYIQADLSKFLISFRQFLSGYPEFGTNNQRYSLYQTLLQTIKYDLFG